MGVGVRRKPRTPNSGLDLFRWLIASLGEVQTGVHCPTCSGGSGFRFDPATDIAREVRRVKGGRVRIGQCSNGHSIAVWGPE